MFQHGGFGGADAGEYLRGGPRVAAFLDRYGARVRRWNTPEPDGLSPEAEWGFEPALLEDLRRFAGERGLRVVRLRYDDPQAFSPFVADLHRWWYRRLGVSEGGLVASSFILMDPFTTLQGRGVPFWGGEQFDRAGAMLFAHGTRSIGLAPIERWQRIRGRARVEGRFLGVSERAYPGDFATFACYQPALASFLPRLPPLPRLTLSELETFIAENGSQPGVAWDGRRPAAESKPPRSADAVP